VKLVIAISPEHYDPFLKECEIGSREYTSLKNAIVALSSNDGHERRIIQILCDEDEAAHLLDAANRLYPEAAQAILAGMNLTLRPYLPE
jgi:hypothetical protein